ncbi:TetR/AcrR family transcriptional regulator [Myroides guanonis]|uniref:Transcriptional regulator, TetR family n=1 Tax=Myroides guanonis TaxID=1150112 RepID=A0A1I3R909_9FLAO|nr:TetR/AcrR family transcriptional regulator [Myroides guanonis]SFJ42828.1 transcriptional regulator, TetR family [Myroides guanonis]
MSNMKKDSEKKESKPRKVYSGPLRDKARTQDRLINTVGSVLEKRGYAGLTLANVGKASGLDRKNIYNYFGNFETLIKAYIDKKEFWKVESKNKIADILESSGTINKEQITDLLQDQFVTLMEDPGLQKIIHWEMAENSELLRTVADDRERVGEELFNILEKDFVGNEAKMRSSFAMILGGIYYLTIHASSNGSTICGIDVNTEEGSQIVKETLDEMIAFVFDKYSKK